MARVNLGTSTTSYGLTSNSYQRKIVKTTTGKLVLFVALDTGIGYKTSDDNGVTWSASWTLVETYYKPIDHFDICIDGDNNIYLVWRYYYEALYFKKLTYNSGTWTIGTIRSVAGGYNSSPTIIKRASGELFITYYYAYLGNYRLYGAYSIDDGVTWDNDNYITTSPTYNFHTVWCCEKEATIWAIATTSDNKLKYFIWDDIAKIWDSGTDIATITSSYNTSLGCNRFSDSEIYAATRTSSGIRIYKYNGSSWDSGTLLSDNANDESPAISNINSKPVVCWRDYDGTNWDISYRKWNGSSWDTQVDLTSDAEVDKFPSVCIFDTDWLYVCYYTGTTSPYTIYFDKVNLNPTHQVTILSDAKIKIENIQKTILSDADIILFQAQKTITSDSKIIGTYPKTILSDTKIKVTNIPKSINSDTEIIRRIQKIITSDSEIVIIIEQEKQISTWFGTTFGEKINTDIRTRKETDIKINTDLRFIKQKYEDISLTPLARTDFHIKIGTPEVELGDDDLILDSIKITHTADNKSTATFSLTRKHDDINNPITIIGNPWVRIYIKDKLNFLGMIQKLDCSSSEERIDVYAESQFASSTYNIITKELPLTLLNEKIHLYDILLNNISIDNPYILSNEENPRYYKGIKIHLGTKITEQVIRYDLGHAWIEDLEEGTFKFKPNYTYFWTVHVKLFDIWAGGGSKVFYNKYIGTSLAPISGDLYEIVGAHYKHQRILDDKEEDVYPANGGYYIIGFPPYKEVTAKNGIRIPVSYWEDREDGLYRVTGISYDYEQYCKNIAFIEFEKIKNINGNILPRTSANIDLTIDGYLYYGLKLLTRINLVNTTSPNIYKNANGFPVSIKQITIDSGTMKVSLNCDNNKSDWELERLTGLYPDEPIEDPGQAKLYAIKFDLPTEEEVDG